LLPRSFMPFFFQMSHLSYFTARSARLLLEMCGFSVEMGYLHKYDIYNLIHWAQTGNPGIFDTGYFTHYTDIFDSHFRSIYTEEVERLGVASHLFIKAIK
jgi:hypothetical protein